MKIKTEADLFGFDDDQPYFRWTPDSTRLMLELRFARQEQFQQRQRQKKELWNEIAMEMQRQGDFLVSGDGCDLKYRNMLQTYKKNRQKDERGQQSLIVWEFYEMFKQAMKNNGDGIDEMMPSLLCESVCLDDDSLDGTKDVNNKTEDEPLEEQAIQTVIDAKYPTTRSQRKRSRLSSTQSQSRHTVDQSTQVNVPIANCSGPTAPRVDMHNESNIPAWLAASELQEYKVFGESVALQIAHIKESPTRALLQLKIQELLYLAKTGKLK